MRLYLFDLDGTLIENHMRDAPCPGCAGPSCRRCKGRGTVLEPCRDYGEVAVMPGRRHALEYLRDTGARVGVCTNQGGVAFGHQTEEEVGAKLTVAWNRLGLYEPGPPTSVHVCFAHPSAPGPRHREPVELARRKPEPGMLLEAMAQHGVSPDWTGFVGDLETDERAAAAAGVRFWYAEPFFAEAP